MTEVVLHQWQMSPFCNKVRKCLRFKAIPYEVRNYNGLLARHAAKLSAVGTLPVLEYGGERIVDSAAIAAFLDRVKPDPPLYPRDTEERARARIWEDWAGQSLYFFELHFRMIDPEAMEKALDIICEGRPRWERALLKVAFRSTYPRKLREQGLGRLTHDEIEQRLFRHLEDIEAILLRHEWLVGQKPSIADFAVGAQIEEIVRTSHIAPQVLAYPHIADWLARLSPDNAPAKARSELNALGV